MKNPWSDPARILVALLLGAMAGALIAASAGIGTLTAGAVFAFAGDLFLRLLQMIVVPLVATSIITSVARLARDHAFARLGSKTVAFFAGTTVRSNFLINLGYGDTAGLFPRSPRLSFDEAARIA